MTNPEYQRLLRRTPSELRERLPGDGPGAAELATLLAGVADAELHAAVRNLGGHDLAALRDAFAPIDDTRPTVIFAYTVKGYGLADRGPPAEPLRAADRAQLRELADRLGTDPDDPWAAVPAGSAEGRRCAPQAAARLRRDPRDGRRRRAVPADLGRTPRARATTQAALGRALLDLTRPPPRPPAGSSPSAPTSAPAPTSAAGSTRSASGRRASGADWFADDAETILHWRERPTGQHIELGIAETNLVGLLGELGATWSRWGEPLLPIGVLYDPFVERALEPWSFGIYAGGQSILVGTPSGVTPRAGGRRAPVDHDPVDRPRAAGLRQLRAGVRARHRVVPAGRLARLGRPGGTSAYLRLSTRPVDQTLAAVPADPAARELRRRQVRRGRLPAPAAPGRRRSRSPRWARCSPRRWPPPTGWTRLGTGADVICVTSPDLLYRAVPARDGLQDEPSWILDQVFPASRARPLVTVLDGHPHTLAFLAGINGVGSVQLGVYQFGQSGDAR